VAARGVGAFYDCADESGVARALIAAQRAHRRGRPELAGRMTCADLAATAAVGPTLRAPLTGDYRGAVVRTMPPPSSGGLCLMQMLAMVERFPLDDGAAGFGFGAADTLNVMMDAMRLCFADRARWMGDTDGRADLPVSGLIDPAYVGRRAASCPDPDPADDAYCLLPGQRLAMVRAGDPRPEAGQWRPAVLPRDGDGGNETTHVSIVDRWGNIVTATATIESLWGSGLMVPGHGFVLNNQLTDFNLRPTASAADGAFDPGANDVGPGRRPRSSMAPTILFVRDAAGRERPVAAYGSPGGATIITTVFAITLNLIDHGMTLQAAIDAPRLSLTGAAAAATTAIEAGFAAATLSRLAALGYRFAAPAPIGSVQAVTVDPLTGRQAGGADARRRGTVIGLQPAPAP
jgi:gamma-glutamyltranspeptidase/glutathione hydrolase